MLGDTIDVTMIREVDVEGKRFGTYAGVSLEMR